MTASPRMEEERAFLELCEALAWRFSRRISGARPGQHRGRHAGSEGTFNDLSPLFRHPDPRRIDIRRTVADPFGETWVRRFAMPSTVTLHLMVDLSASIAATGATDRHRLAALLAGAFAGAVRLSGDACALAIAQGDAAEVVLAPGRDSGRALAVREAVETARPAGRGVEGLVRLAPLTPVARTLVVLMSDFEITGEEAERLLAAFGSHALLPLWLRDSALEAEERQHPGRVPRLLRLTDPETGRARTSVVTPARWDRWRQQRERQRAEVAAAFHRHARDPVEIRDRIAPADLAAELARRVL
ncbi:hypothetical protein [Haematobacter sp.]|uniref:DUF58 domain-containing protein n=1 Tax=Haematobacter sp. TaxID=2953762 RepID=UPI0028A70166|nr:hypothetical protein [Haematobacter sp.]